MKDSSDSAPPTISMPFRRAGQEDPGGTWDALRERAPIVRVSEDARKGTYWAIMRHDDVVAAARNTDVFVNRGHDRLRLRRLPLESDPPEHTNIRRLLQPFFLPARLQEFEPLSRQIAISCIEPLVAARGGDAAEAIAKPVPPQVLLTLIGQSRDDWRQIKQWCEDVYLDRSPEAADRDRFQKADAALWDYSERAVDDRVHAPRDPGRDLISTMLAAAIDGRPVDPELVVGVIRLFIAAGHDSTTSSVAICLHHLAESGSDQSLLRRNPTMIPAAIEEILRVKTPVLGMPRTVAKDVEFAGQFLKAGDRVRLMWAAANRDPRAIEHADRCVIERTPPRTLTFGFGIHMCIGAPLARQEVKVVLEELLARSNEFGLAGEPIMQFWHPHGAHRLPIWIKPK